MLPIDPDDLHRFTRHEYHQLGQLGIFEHDRVELVHGLVRHKRPIAPHHAYSVDQLAEVLFGAVGPRGRVRIQQPVAASEHSEPEPDVAVCPRGTYLSDHPAEAWLVVEVAQASLSYDRTEKAALYAAMGVPDYWVVNLVDGVIEVYREPGTEGYAHVEVLHPGASVRLLALSGVVVEVSDILPPS